MADRLTPLMALPCEEIEKGLYHPEKGALSHEKTSRRERKKNTFSAFTYWKGETNH
jgi:hypothetical protein